MQTLLLLAALLVAAAVPALAVGCPDGSTCPTSETCCQLSNNNYGCCPYTAATCCADMVHCCPQGFTCNAVDGSCDYQGQRNGGRGKPGKKDARSTCNSSSHGEPIRGPLPNNCDSSSHGEPIRGPVLPKDKLAQAGGRVPMGRIRAPGAARK